MTPAKLTLGPLLFNWTPEAWRDFHFRVADEAPVDAVQLGEIVCSKRAPFLAEHFPAVIERLAAAGKEVVLSTPTLVTLERERRGVRDLLAGSELLVEANDMGALPLLAGRRHAIGPMINVYNEGGLAFMAKRGAMRVTFPAELTGAALAAIAPTGRELGVEMEVQAFGRLPLAISARCYHARAHGLHKDGCQFVCGEDLDGMEVTTLDGESFLTVNGTQTMSFGYHALTGELAELRQLGIERFRLWPHSFDMVTVARLYRDLLDGRIDAETARAGLAGLVGAAGLANGFYHGREGAGWQAAE